METDASPSKTVGPSTLSRLKDAEGAWQKEVIETLSVGTWARWFMNRLEGNDPYFPYRRGEFPQGANDLFFNLFRNCPNLDTEPAAEGLGIYLRYLHWRHCSEEQTPPSVEVRQALELLLAIRPRDTRARPVLRRVLRDFVCNDLLLNREAEHQPHTVSAADLHREALVALSVLQRRGDTDDWDVWNVHRTKRAFEEDHTTFDPRYALTAFSGIALSSPTPSALLEGMIPDLFRLMEKANQTLRPRHSLEALFVDRSDQRQQIFAYLLDETRRLADPQERWEQIREWLARFPGNVPSYDRMARLRSEIDLGEPTVSKDSAEPLGKDSWDGMYDTIRECEPAI